MRAVVAILALAALVAAGCGGGDPGEAGEAVATPAREAAPGGVERGGAERPQAPAVEGLTLEGERLSLADFAGQPVLVNVWSSW